MNFEFETYVSEETGLQFLHASGSIDDESYGELDGLELEVTFQPDANGCQIVDCVNVNGANWPLELLHDPDRDFADEVVAGLVDEAIELSR